MIKHEHELLWPLDLISVEEEDIGKRWLLHFPHEQQGPCTGFFSLLLLEAKCNRKYHKVEVVSNWSLWFFSR